MDSLRSRLTRGCSDNSDLRVDINSVQLSNFDQKFSPSLSSAQTLDYSSDFHLRTESVPFVYPTAQSAPNPLSGWRLGALAGAGVALVSLVLNIAAIGWLASHHDASSGLVQIYEGDCKRVKSLNIWVHLIINAISTLLLGGSNYCMQCLTAPTRAEIDKAHDSSRFLDIGVPSLRNLRRVSRHKTILWWLLGLSSIPLHLMYNSAFYSSIAAIDYDYLIATEDFVNGAPFTLENVTSPLTVSPATIQQELVTYEKLTNAQCLRAYGQVISTQRRNVVVVVAQNVTGENPLLFGGEYSFSYDVISTYRPFEWMCSSDPELLDKLSFPQPYGVGHLPTCDTYISRLEAISNQWSPYGYQAEYCLSQPAVEKCSFNGNIPIIAIVIVCNTVKVLIMLFVALKLAGTPLITIGDAIQSFLQQPDLTTKEICWISRREIIDYKLYAQHFPDPSFPADKAQTLVNGKAMSAQRRRWFSAAGEARWVSTVTFFVFTLAVTGGLLRIALDAIAFAGGESMAKLGFGELQPQAVISGWKIDEISSPANQILTSVLIANLPQLILSFLYLNLNGLLTTMWLAAEWNTFANSRKFLRVSSPKGEQRSSHFLQLPYKIAIPLMGLSGLIHWTISQSIFLAVVAGYNPAGELISPTQVASCGYSVMAIIVTMVLGSCLIVATMCLGFRKYDGGIPLVGSCSAAISAACHRPEWDDDAAMKPLQYGALPDSSLFQDPDVGHCCFTSGEVFPVQKGKKYA